MIVSKKYFPELSQETYSIEELIKYPFVILTSNSLGRKLFNNYLNQKNINFKPTYEFNSHSICYELIKQGFGICIGYSIHYQNKDYYKY